VVPTPLGITLVKGYSNIDPDLCLPDVRSHIEKQITLIAQGKAEYAQVVRSSLRDFAAKFAYFVSQVRLVRRRQ
jgi:DNA topoisomerase-3